jgi:nitrate/nitrite transport system ATP-binding protein
MAYIDVSGVFKSFPVASGFRGFRGGRTRPVLRDVSLAVDRGGFVCIVGAMGSGKTTLLSILAGLLAPDGGTVLVGGEPVREVRSDAAFVFQNYSLLPWFSALENVRLAVAAAAPALPRRTQIERARAALEQVGLGNAVQRRPSQLSGGMRQRVAIARAFATDPQVLFLDEPFGALDALTRETLQQDLMRLCSSAERPVTTIMVTNSVEEAILLADMIVPMLPGPPATLGRPIPVALPRPRTPAQLAYDEGAARVRVHVIATLTDALGARMRRAPAKPVDARRSTALAAEESR